MKACWHTHIFHELASCYPIDLSYPTLLRVHCSAFEMNSLFLFRAFLYGLSSARYRGFEHIMNLEMNGHCPCFCSISFKMYGFRFLVSICSKWVSSLNGCFFDFGSLLQSAAVRFEIACDLAPSFFHRFFDPLQSGSSHSSTPWCVGFYFIVCKSNLVHWVLWATTNDMAQ